MSFLSTRALLQSNEYRLHLLLKYSNNVLAEYEDQTKKESFAKAIHFDKSWKSWVGMKRVFYFERIGYKFKLLSSMFIL